MKTISLKECAFLVMIFMCLSLMSQIDSLEGFDENHAREHIKHVVDSKEQEKFMEQIKRNWIIRKYNLRPYQYQLHDTYNNFNGTAKLGNNADIMQGPQPSGCSNIDFESGNTTGWTMTNTSSGSGYFQVVNSGVDMWGGFPMVYPGGTYSLRLGTDWAVGCNCTTSSMGNFCTSMAQRVIPVNATNAQFALHFAFVVYNFPHSPSEAAYVEIKLLDASGNQLPCPYFKVYWDGNANQFVGLSGATPQFGGIDTRCYTGCSNCDVTYLPWTTVNVDLSPYIGQNVTLQASVHWCVYQVDWAYAYIDADCTSSNFSIPPACVGSNICAPAGFASYNWSIPGGGSATGQCITATTSGIYTVVCNPIISCSSPQTVTVSVGGGFTANVTSTNVSCYGGSNGSASVSVTGASPPLSYTWLPTGGNNALATGLSPGTYSVIVQDANCSVTNTVNITQPSPMTLSIASSSATCSNPGSATVSVTGGGTSPYTYTWLPSGGNASVATGLSAGNYTALVADANTCTASINVTIGGASIPNITSVNTISVSCNGGSNGSATVNVSGGATPYNYTWTPSVSTSSVATGLSAGSYSVNVMDNNNCTTSTVITILQPPALSLTATQTQSVTCNGGNNGSASVVASGGMGGYTYTWMPSGGNASTASGLTAGVYTVSVNDANNCNTTQTVQIIQPPALSLTVTQTQSVSCNGGNNGIASATASGGVGGYIYTWMPSGGNSATASGLTVGTYTINVADANNCNISATVQIVQPPALSLSINTQSASCSTPGSATANVSGGVGGYTYTWSPSGGNNNIATGLSTGNYTVFIQDANGCQINGSATITGAPFVYISSVNTTSVSCNNGSNGSATLNISGGTAPFNFSWTPSVSTSSIATNLSAGTYSAYVIDANNCTSSTVITISQPPALSLTVTQTQSVSCNGGNNGIASAVASGGVGGYIYTWTPSGGNAATATGITAGLYTINVQDANACSISTSVQIVQPPALSLTATQTQSVSCNGGNNGIASSTVSGGVGGYTYTWTPSGGNSATASGLTTGIYTITVSDANLCGPISTTVQIQEPPALSITVSGQSVTCYGYSDGSATVNVTGGVGGYSYTWTPTGGNASVANNLIANTYTINVLDANACFISAIINIPQPSSVSIVTIPNQTICFGNSANIMANASGGNGPYTYNWSNGLSNSGGPHLVSPTVTTIYTVQAVDANNCLSPVGNTKVTVLPPLQAIGMQTTVCDGLSVSIYPTITSPGNGGAYSYLWSNGQTAATISVNGNYALGSTNIYTVFISDGCSVPDAVTEITVNVHPNPVFSFTAIPQKGCVPLTVQFSATADTLSNMFLWNFDNGSSANTAQSVTTYTLSGMYSPTLTVSNIYGCTATTVALNYIEAYPIPDADFDADPWGTSIITPTINFINTSQGAVSYLWNFGDYSSPTNTSTAVNPSHEYMYSGSYTVTLIATNQYGCSDYVAKSIYIEPEFHLYIPNAFTPDGNGLNDVFQPKGIGIDENDYKMLIFDRWGELVYESNNFAKGWDGSVKGSSRKATQDVYVYKIYVKDIKGNKHEFVGHVTCLPGESE